MHSSIKMSEQMQNTQIINKETDSDTSHNKARNTLLRSDLNETSSPKVTAETFTAQSRDKLKDVFFSGTYEDRVFVECLQGYRDRVIIDEEESRFIKSLKSVLKRGKRLHGEQFQGIKKDDDDKMCIYVHWTKITEPPPFGTYWFLVDNIIFLQQGGVEFILRQLREKENVNTGKLKSCPKCGTTLDQSANSSTSQIETELSLNELARDLQSKFIGLFGQPSEWWENAKPHLSISNVMKVFKLIVLLLVALVTGIGTFVQALVPKVNNHICIEPFFRTIDAIFVSMFRHYQQSYWRFLSFVYHDVERYDIWEKAN